MFWKGVNEVRKGVESEAIVYEKFDGKGVNLRE